jgi:hypothetical protein
MRMPITAPTMRDDANASFSFSACSLLSTPSACSSACTCTAAWECVQESHDREPGFGRGATKPPSRDGGFAGSGSQGFEAQTPNRRIRRARSIRCSTVSRSGVPQTVVQTTRSKLRPSGRGTLKATSPRPSDASAPIIIRRVFVAWSPASEAGRRVRRLPVRARHVRSTIRRARALSARSSARLPSGLSRRQHPRRRLRQHHGAPG